jgi:hypothetical protein
MLGEYQYDLLRALRVNAFEWQQLNTIFGYGRNGVGSWLDTEERKFTAPLSDPVARHYKQQFGIRVGNQRKDFSALVNHLARPMGEAVELSGVGSDPVRQLVVWFLYSTLNQRDKDTMLAAFRKLGYETVVQLIQKNVSWQSIRGVIANDVDASILDSLIA